MLAGDVHLELASFSVSRWLSILAASQVTYPQPTPLTARQIATPTATGRSHSQVESRVRVATFSVSWLSIVPSLSWTRAPSWSRAASVSSMVPSLLLDAGAQLVYGGVGLGLNLLALRRGGGRRLSRRRRLGGSAGDGGGSACGGGGLASSGCVRSARSRMRPTAMCVHFPAAPRRGDAVLLQLLGDLPPTPALGQQRLNPGEDGPIVLGLFAIHAGPSWFTAPGSLSPVHRLVHRSVQLYPPCPPFPALQGSARLPGAVGVVPPLSVRVGPSRALAASVLGSVALVVPPAFGPILGYPSGLAVLAAPFSALFVGAWFKSADYLCGRIRIVYDKTPQCPGCAARLTPECCPRRRVLWPDPAKATDC